MWQADITYVATKEGWLYVAGVLDACSRRIVGWAADDAMPTTLVARAFERAVQTQRPSPGLLHHSDRGSQYASGAYRELLRRHGVIPSMSRAANCYDNAKMESFWATLKGELIGDHVFATRAEAKSAIFSYIEIFYNRTRLSGFNGAGLGTARKPNNLVPRDKRKPASMEPGWEQPGNPNGFCKSIASRSSFNGAGLGTARKRPRAVV